MVTRARVEGIVHVSPETPVEDMLALYRRDRALIVDRLADEGTLAQLRKDLEGPLDRAALSARDDAFTGARTKRAGALIAEAPACRPLVIHPLILALMTGIFGRSSSFQVNSTQAMAVQPGEVDQALHRDRWNWIQLPLPPDFECIVNCMWAIENFSAASGATRVVPRSFELPEPRSLMKDLAAITLPDGTAVASLDTVPAEMSSGSVLIYSGSLYHGAGANGSDRPRVGMSLSYVPVTLRQEENQYLVVPPEIARELPEKLQKLIGYELGNYSLGFVNGMKSGMTLLRRGAAQAGSPS